MAVTAGPGEPSSSPSSLPPPHPEQQQTGPVTPVDSDMAIILASLLCALVCVLGLALVSRCACRRRRSNSTSSSNPPPKGLKKKAIDALPRVSFAAAGAQSSSSSVAACSSPLECAICLAEFTDGESVRVLPHCGHNFHVACVDAWLRTCATCPSCRTPIVATPAQQLVAPTMVVVVVAGGAARWQRRLVVANGFKFQQQGT
ncbi:RING-H2 finger protein ATL44 [Triticum urartu]|uniref:RING-type E3 ubiquitin transferase n=1 Tax=Triticum urartu TaxID=4572 RepID=M7Z4B5_TRIUA|nr:RING-H2 finger protein ATL44 [Triticum urartu]